MAKRAFFDDIRSLAFGSISGTYAAVGTPLDYTTRGVCFTNLTAGIMIFSYDSSSVAGKVIVPAGSQHNVINVSAADSLKMYTIYSPAHHKDGVVRTTKAEAEADGPEFDGKTTE